MGDAQQQRIGIVGIPDQEVRDLLCAAGKAACYRAVEIHKRRTFGHLPRLHLLMNRSSISSWKISGSP